MLYSVGEIVNWKSSYMDEAEPVNYRGRLDHESSVVVTKRGMQVVALTKDLSKIENQPEEKDGGAE